MQGGGSWGAYTWGVLDALLASRRVDIVQLSGTSAGAINAAIVASALAKGTPAQARESLRAFWLRIADPAFADVVRAMWGPLGHRLRHSVGDWLLAGGALSPYGANPLGLNPLRSAIEAHVDIDAIRSKSSPALYVTVTNVKTGLPRVISNDAMSIDALLASACLPELFQAVELDGEAYWDGGYCGNPTLWPMIHNGAARDDLIVVQLVSDLAGDVPVDARSIRRRVGEIVFNSSLVAEMQAIAAMRDARCARQRPGERRPTCALHRIGPPREALADRRIGQRALARWLQRLHEEGLAAGRQFMSRHGRDLGVRETLDVAKVFSDGHKPRMRAPHACRLPRPQRSRRDYVATAATPDQRRSRAQRAFPRGEIRTLQMPFGGLLECAAGADQRRFGEWRAQQLHRDRQPVAPTCRPAATTRRCRGNWRHV